MNETKTTVEIVKLWNEGERGQAFGALCDRIEALEGLTDGLEITAGDHNLRWAALYKRLGLLPAPPPADPDALPSLPDEWEGGAIHIVFDGPPSHESGRFVEVETPDGKGISVGRWEENETGGYWSLVIDDPTAELRRLLGQEHTAQIDRVDALEKANEEITQIANDRRDSLTESRARIAKLEDLSGECDSCRESEVCKPGRRCQCSCHADPAPTSEPTVEPFCDRCPATMQDHQFVSSASGMTAVCPTESSPEERVGTIDENDPDYWNCHCKSKRARRHSMKLTLACRICNTRNPSPVSEGCRIGSGIGDE